MNALRLRFQNREHADLTLSPGVHAIGYDRQGVLGSVSTDGAVAQFCVDRRGVWLQVREGAPGLHVNGRPVRRVAMLRVGDAIFVDGTELVLLAGEPLPAPADYGFSGGTDTRMLVRGVGGPYHGRSFTLEHPRTVGRAGESDIRINEPTFSERHARLEAHADGVVLRDLGSVEGSLVNGRPVRHALLQPGDQVVFGNQHRFVVESPVQRAAAGEVAPAPSSKRLPVVEETRVPSALPRSVRRMPWLLLAALLIAAALSLLLLYGAR
ncbi:FHA domain-containing protein [Lysobacter sp. LF1]|uniref:FHA domain-containing protein n=1 Tax=Lysobacter stagni TaxID=3045172 RepID=A0ABT6XIY6_9GAMM|nr:FHA domain-containing protein [Lysobacter sp. LF1]MDI9240127.1 FHA domain-containing protein [Lysobacter sp. LF1]